VSEYSNAWIDMRHDNALISAEASVQPRVQADSCQKGRPLPRRLASSGDGGSLVLPRSGHQAGIEVRAKLSMILASWLFKRCESHK